MKRTIKSIASLLTLTAIAAGTFTYMKQDNSILSSEGYIGRSGIVIEDGKMTPEALLAFGRLSDPQEELLTGRSRELNYPYHRSHA